MTKTEEYVVQMKEEDKKGYYHKDIDQMRKHLDADEWHDLGISTYDDFVWSMLGHIRTYKEIELVIKKKKLKLTQLKTKDLQNYCVTQTKLRVPELSEKEIEEICEEMVSEDLDVILSDIAELEKKLSHLRFIHEQQSKY